MDHGDSRSPKQCSSEFRLQLQSWSGPAVPAYRTCLVRIRDETLGKHVHCEDAGITGDCHCNVSPRRKGLRPRPAGVQSGKYLVLEFHREEAGVVPFLVVQPIADLGV